MPITNLTKHFDFLDQIPEKLYKSVVILHHGNLQDRVSGLLLWRKNLLSGQLPKPSLVSWPEREISEIILQRLEALDIIALCKEEESLTDEVLLSICDAIHSIIQRKRQGIHQLFDDILEKTQKKSENNNSQVLDDKKNTTTSNKMHNFPPAIKSVTEPTINTALPQNESEYEHETHNQLTTEETGISNLDAQEFAQQLSENMQLLKSKWDEVKQIFEDMGTQLGKGWDLSRGVLVSQGWQEFVRYRRLIKNYPLLTDIVNSIGRTQSHTQPKHEDEYNQTKKLPEQTPVTIKKTKSVESPTTIRGLQRSDDFIRMLPSEAVMLGHAKLHMLWHIKRAERALLCYQAEGVLSTHIPQTKNTTKQLKLPAKSQQGTLQKGPMIICIDTSASMKGKSEIIAKAITLEFVRLANKQQRKCFLIAFSGPGEIVEQELKLDYAGLRHAIQFLQSSFHGGTDVSEALEKALNKAGEKQWNKADIVLVSDGLFRISQEYVKQLKMTQKQTQIRIHGLLTNNSQTIMMSRICQPLYQINNL